MPLPLIPILGPFLLKRLTGRIGEKWAERAAGLVSILAAAALIFGLAWWIRADGWSDGRKALIAEQAKAKAAADAVQRERERQAEQDRRDELKTGASTDAAQQKEISDATKNLPDARPSDRVRSRICVELQQQARRKSEPAPEC